MRQLKFYSNSIESYLLFRNDDDETSKTKKKSDSDDNHDNDDDNDEPTDDVSGDEIKLPTIVSTERSSIIGSLVLAKWFDDHFYSGVISNIIDGEK